MPRNERTKLFLQMYTDRMRDNGYKLWQIKFKLDIGRQFSQVGPGCPERLWATSTAEDAQNSTGQGPEQPGLSWAFFEQGFKPECFQRWLPTKITQ